MEKKKFTGYVISGGPVTVQESKKAGIIKDSEEEKKCTCPNCKKCDTKIPKNES